MLKKFVILQFVSSLSLSAQAFDCKPRSLRGVPTAVIEGRFFEQDSSNRGPLRTITAGIRLALFDDRGRAVLEAKGFRLPGRAQVTQHAIEATFGDRDWTFDLFLYYTERELQQSGGALTSHVVDWRTGVRYYTECLAR